MPPLLCRRWRNHTTVVIVLMMACAAARLHAQAPKADQAIFLKALADKDYELARKLAIRSFRPDWHCMRFAHEASAVMLAAEKIMMEYNDWGWSVDVFYDPEGIWQEPLKNYWGERR